MYVKGRDAQLSLLADITNAFSRNLDIDQTLANGIERIMDLMDAQAASVFLFDEGDQLLVCRACAGPDGVCAGVLGLELEPGEGIIGRAALSDQPVMVRDVNNDPDFAAFVDAATGFRSSSIIAAPLLVNETSLGAIEVINKQGGELFDDGDGAALSMLATAAALAIHNARMTHALVSQQRIRRELELAREIQANLMPAPRQDYPVSGLNVPALEVSGDFYDFFDFDDGRIGFNLADVSGKGMNAALFGVKAATLLRSMGRDNGDPGALLMRVNEELSAHNNSLRGMFVTAIAGVFDPATGVLTYANAGHLPPLLVKGNEVIQLPQAKMPPLGIARGFQYPSETLNIKDAFLYLYTDGLSEALDDQGKELGIEGVMALLLSLQGLAVEPRLNALVNRQGQMKRDDITVLVIEGALNRLPPLRVSASPESLSLLRQYVQGALLDSGCASEVIHDTVLAVNEAAMNVIQHGVVGDNRCAVDFVLTVLVEESWLSFELVDSALASDFECYKGRAFGDIKPGGLGLHFIHEIMDEVRYSHLPDGAGNRLVMRKRLV